MLAISKGSIAEIGKSILQASAISCAFRPLRVRSVELVPFATFPLYPHDPT